VKPWRRRWRARVYRWVLNLWPCIRGTGVRVVEITPDFRLLRGRLPLNWRTRNRVGTIFGGSLYAATDPFYMLILMERLGKDFVVWDKAATVRFRRPGRSTLHFEVRVEEETEAEIRRLVAEKGEIDYVFRTQMKDASGVVHADIEKTVYVATREGYKAKLARRAARADA
jgi:acyl-coenzyme A thioesterase PaaI-like protein